MIRVLAIVGILQYCIFFVMFSSGDCAMRLFFLLFWCTNYVVSSSFPYYLADDAEFL